MSDTVIIALITGAPAALIALGGLIVSLKNSTKSDTIIEKADGIHILADGNLSKVTASLNVALTKIDGLENLVSSLMDAKRAADTLASNTLKAQTGEPT